MVKNKKVEVYIDNEWKVGYISTTGIWKIRNNKHVEYVGIRFREYDDERQKEVTKEKQFKIDSKRFRMVKRWKKFSPKKN